MLNISITMAKNGARKKIPKKKPELQPSNQIAKSKHLLRKKRDSKNNRSIINRNTTIRRSKQENLRLSDNQNRLPSLADLEKLFEESDESVMVPSTSTPNSPQSESNEIPKKVVSNDILLPCVVLTSIQPQLTALIKQNAGAFSTFDDDCDEEGPSNKKLKKNLEPSVCDSLEVADSPKSFDSGETIIYDVETSGRFSPLPSTSKDSAKIHENEKRFNASLIKSNANVQNNETCSTKLNDESLSDVEIIEAPVETITIIDMKPNSVPLIPNQEPVDSGIVIILDDDSTRLNDREVIQINDSTNITKNLANMNSPQIVDPVNETNGNEIIDVENYVNSRDSGRDRDSDSSGMKYCYLSNIFGPLVPKMDLLLNNLGNALRYNKEQKKETTLEINSSTPKINKQNSQSLNDCRSVLKICPICMDSLATKDLASTICGHIFCMDCMETVHKKRIRKCPTCRKGLKGVGYHQIFL